MDEQVRRFHHGPLFSGGLSLLGFILFIVGVVLGIGAISTLNLSLGLSALLLLGFGGDLARNVRGVIIDKKARTVMSYTQVLGMRRGPSVSLDDFGEVVLQKKRETVRSGNFYSSTDSRGSLMGLQTFNSLELELWKKDGSQLLFLAECGNHPQGIKQLQDVAAWLELPARDALQNKKDQLQERRSKSDPRSRKGRRR